MTDVEPQYTAGELLAKIRETGARVYRMRETVVICLTDDQKVAQRLDILGARLHNPHTNRQAKLPYGAHLRARDGKPEWDLRIDMIPVLGEETIWEAAGR